MSAYTYEYFVAEFISRSLSNFEIIDSVKDFKKKLTKTNIDDENLSFEEIKNFIRKANTNEVTQLMNSLFGALIVPYEYYKQKISGKNFEANCLSMYPEYKIIVDIIDNAKRNSNYRSTYRSDCCESYKSYKVRNFLNHLRNSLAHSGNKRIIFYPCEEHTEIKGVYFFDEYNNENFCVKLEVETIKKLVIAISSLFLKFDKDDKNTNVKNQNYINAINDMNKFLLGVENEIRLDKKM